MNILNVIQYTFLKFGHLEKLFSACFPLKGHTYLSKPAAFSWKYVWPSSGYEALKSEESNEYGYVTMGKNIERIQASQDINDIIWTEKVLWGKVHRYIIRVDLYLSFRDMTVSKCSLKVNSKCTLSNTWGPSTSVMEPFLKSSSFIDLWLVQKLNLILS